MRVIPKSKATFVALILVLCVVLQPASAGMILIDEPEISGGSLRVLRAIVGGVAGFVVGGVVGGVMGAGLMAVIDPMQGRAGCEDIGGPIVY